MNDDDEDALTVVMLSDPNMAGHPAGSHCAGNYGLE